MIMKKTTKASGVKPKQLQIPKRGLKLLVQKFHLTTLSFNLKKLWEHAQGPRFNPSTQQNPTKL